MAKYELVLQGARVADFRLGIDGRFDLGISGGKIKAVEPHISKYDADHVFSLEGYAVLPGIVDLHVHTAFGSTGHNAFHMLARAGVTTVLDCGGPIDQFLEEFRMSEVGINAACIQMIKPGYTVSSSNPSRSELVDVTRKYLREGCLGLKLLGGHYPLTPEATREAIDVANSEGAYVCFHVGSLATGAGTLISFREAVELAGENHLHLAHVNSYCRGQVLGDPVAETLEVLETLDAHRNLVSESYLSVFSGSPGKCVNGMLESLGPRNSLAMAGYGGSEEELARAILDGFAGVVADVGGENVVLKGKEAYDYWRAHGTDVTCTFPVTPGSTRFLLATQKNRDGRFIVDAISTDGGGIPRNFILSKGLSLVRLDAMTLTEFTAKTSYFPAQILGLKSKGSLAPGFDADLTVVDMDRQTAVMSFVQGQPVMINGMVLKGTPKVITTAEGAEFLRNKGFRTIQVELEESWFYRGRV
ncbi:MAG TPA: amidohydrolase family protein [Firmicutes bacterium]|nr:amidohydrolase family protein [Candidatus Fermentithermobacillaceae bacterium]